MKSIIRRLKPFLFVFSLLFVNTALKAQDFQWVAQFGGASEEVVTDLAIDTNGESIACGYFGNTMFLDNTTLSTQGFRDGFLLKTDQTGQLIWHVQMGSFLDDEAKRVGIDNQGNIYLLINHNDTMTVQGQQIFSTSYWSVLKFDSGGNLLLHFNPFSVVPTFFSVEDMAVNGAGDIALTGSFGLNSSNLISQLQIDSVWLSTILTSGGQYVQQMWTTKFTSNGQFLWAKSSIATGSSGAIAARLDMNENGEVLVAGSFSPDLASSQDINFGSPPTSLTAGNGLSGYTVEYDPSGTAIRATAIPVYFSNPAFPTELRISALDWTESGQIILGGLFQGVVFIGNDTIQTPANGFLPVSWPFLGSISPTQTNDWIMAMEGSQMILSSLTAITTDDQGNVYAGGVFNDSLRIGSQLLTGGTQDIYFARLDSAGQVDWVETGDGDNAGGIAMELNALRATPAGNLYLGGSLDAPGNFGGIQVSEPFGNSCCANAFISLYADSCSATPPMASFTYSPTNDPQEIQFTSLNSAGESEFWDFGEGHTSTATSPVFRYFVPGPYEVCHIVSNNCGTDTFCQWIYVNCAVTADFDAFSDTTNLTATFTNQSINAHSYIWDFGDGTNDTASNPVHQYAFFGNFTVTLIATGPCGSDTAFQTIATACVPPLADFSFTTDSSNLTATFTNLSTIGETFLWDFGDGTTDTSAHPIHQFPFPGTFTVSLLASGPCGTDTISQSVTVTCDPTLAGFSFTTDSANLTSFFANQSSNANAYFWDFGDGTSDTAANPVHQFSGPGSFTVSLIAFGPCESDTSFQEVIAFCDSTFADFGFSIDSSNLTIAFSNVSLNGESFFWDFGDGTTDTAASPVHQFPFPDTFGVTLIVSGPCWTDTVLKEVITFCDPTDADFDFISDTSNLEVTFTNLSVNAESYFWDFGDGTGDTVLHPVHTFPFPGAFSVSLTVFGACEIDTITKVINTQCSGTLAGFTYQTDSLASTVTFANLSLNAQSYFWDFGDGFTDTATHPVHNYAQPNFYHVTLIALGPCQSDTFRQVIRPDCNVPDVSFSALFDTATQKFLIVSNLATNQNFSWDFGGGIGDTLITNPEITFPSPGLYTISLTVSNFCGSATFKTQLYLPPVLISISDLATDYEPWIAYPIPSAGRWWIASPSSITRGTEIKVFDLYGRSVYQQSIPASQNKKIQINGIKWPAGIYFLSIITPEGIQVITLEKYHQ